MTVPYGYPKRELTNVERDGIDKIVARERELAFRKALEHAGYLPQSIEVAVDKHSDWLAGNS